MPQGFAYCEDAVPPDAAENLIAKFALLPFKSFEFHGYLGNRRTVSFGWSYEYSGRALRKSEPLPDFFPTGESRGLCRRCAGLPRTIDRD